MKIKVNIKEDYCLMAKKNAREFYLRLAHGVLQPVMSKYTGFTIINLN